MSLLNDMKAVTMTTTAKNSLIDKFGDKQAIKPGDVTAYKTKAGGGAPFDTLRSKYGKLPDDQWKTALNAKAVLQRDGKNVSQYNPSSDQGALTSKTNSSVGSFNKFSEGLKGFFEQRNAYTDHKDKLTAQNTLGSFSSSGQMQKAPSLTTYYKTLYNKQKPQSLQERLSNAITNKDAQIWKLSANSTWDEQNNKWKNPYMKIKTPQQLAAAKDKLKQGQTKVAQISVGPKYTARMAFSLLQDLNLFSTNAGLQSLGPINSSGLPIYLGRYLGKNGRVKTLGRPEYFYNKYNYDQALNFERINAISRWNQFAKAVQRYTDVARKQQYWDEYVKQKYKQYDVNRLRKKLMKKVAREIALNNNFFFKDATKQQREALQKTISDWDYTAMTAQLKKIAERLINANKYTALKKKIAQRYLNPDLNFAAKPVAQFQYTKSLTEAVPEKDESKINSIAEAQAKKDVNLGPRKTVRQKGAPRTVQYSQEQAKQNIVTNQDGSAKVTIPAGLGSVKKTSIGQMTKKIQNTKGIFTAYPSKFNKPPTQVPQSNSQAGGGNQGYDDGLGDFSGVQQFPGGVNTRSMVAA